MKILLETKRMILRQYTEDDVENLFELNNDPGVFKWLPYLQVERAKIQDDIQRFISYYDKYNGYGTWAAIEKSKNKFIGWFMFLPFKEMPYFKPELGDPDDIEIGFYFLKDVWGRGYATEGSRALILKGFSEFGTLRVMGTALAANKASIRVMGKVGMRLEKNFFYEEMESLKIPAQEVVICGLNKEEFQQRVAEKAEGQVSF